jgi:hypothetical protein
MGSKPIWATYTKLYSLQFGASDYYPVAEQKHQRKESNLDENPVVIIKTFNGSATLDNIQDIKRIKHKNFVSIRNILLVGSDISVAFEFMPLSLSEIAGNPLIDDLRLASILGPVRHHSFSPVKTSTKSRIDCRWVDVFGQTLPRTHQADMLQYTSRYCW